MRIRTFVTRAALIAVVAAPSAGAAQAAGHHGRAISPASECATVKVTAKPGLNTAMIPETIKSMVTNCSSVTETVTLTQHISGPHAPNAFGTKSWTLTIAAGQTVTKTRSFPYACCGSYTVTDKVRDLSGVQLGKPSSANFTFA